MSGTLKIPRERSSSLVPRPGLAEGQQSFLSAALPLPGLLCAPSEFLVPWTHIQSSCATETGANQELRSLSPAMLWSETF